MNHNQKVYALKRVDEISNDKINKTKEKFYVKEKRISLDEKYDLVEARKVKLIPKEKMERYTDFVYAYDFSKYEHDSYMKEEGIKLIDTIKNLSKKAKDTIMLGDCTEALRIIADLEQISV